MVKDKMVWREVTKNINNRGTVVKTSLLYNSATVKLHPRKKSPMKQKHRSRALWVRCPTQHPLAISNYLI